MKPAALVEPLGFREKPLVGALVGDLANSTMSTIDSGTVPTKHIMEGVRDDQTSFDQRLSDQSRTTHASGREAHEARAQLGASGGTAPELLWESGRTGLLKGEFFVRFGRTRTRPQPSLGGVDGSVSQAIL